jgi:hypothetical protein
MKRIFWSILVSAVACIICAFVTYRFAYRKAYLRGQVDSIHQDSKVASLVTIGALQKFRAGDVPSGTRLLETFCFGQSEVFYHDPTASDGRELAPALIEYRAVYRTNRADWSDTERRLEAQLAGTRCQRRPTRRCRQQPLPLPHYGSGRNTNAE